MDKPGTEMGLSGSQMGQLGHKWVNLDKNGSTWAQIGKYGAQLVKFTV